MTRVRFRHNQRGVIRESDLIICSPAEWEGAAEHDQPEWSIVSVDLGEEIATLIDETDDSGLLPRFVCALNLGELYSGQTTSPKTA